MLIRLVTSLLASLGEEALHLVHAPQRVLASLGGVVTQWKREEALKFVAYCDLEETADRQELLHNVLRADDLRLVGWLFYADRAVELVLPGKRGMVILHRRGDKYVVTDVTVPKTPWSIAA